MHANGAGERSAVPAAGVPRDELSSFDPEAISHLLSEVVRVCNGSKPESTVEVDTPSLDRL
jgi:hypothetical protein